MEDPLPTSIFTLQGEERLPLSITVSRKIRQLIITGKVKMGAELPSEKDLARDLGVGRSTVREALRILQAQGLISGGDTVSTQKPRVSAALALTTAGETMTTALQLKCIPLADLLDLRVLIEGEAAERAAKEPSDDDMNDARNALIAMKKPNVDIETFRAADLRFHKSIVAACGNQAFPLVMGVLRDAIGGHLGEALKRKKSPRAAMNELTREHEEILIAIDRGRGKRARELVETHIRDFYKELV
jgi:GntR family transcriptional regulator, transcriptional repressor for pyruvate dehydrogenase complex